jgi:hypothetical protein
MLVHVHELLPLTAGERDAMNRLVVLTALALGALALTFSAVAIPDQAAQACSKACMNCCY